jgi:hypothetical protein
LQLAAIIYIDKRPQLEAVVEMRAARASSSQIDWNAITFYRQLNEFILAQDPAARTKPSSPLFTFS